MQKNPELVKLLTFGALQGNIQFSQPGLTSLFRTMSAITRLNVGPILLFLSCVPFPFLHAQYRNIQVNSPGSRDPEEVTIAINPVDPMNLIAGANLRYFYRSTDGGSSWTQGQLPPGTWGDPCVTFDANGNAFYGHLLNLPSPDYFIDRIVVHRSSDGGRSWYDSAGIGYNPPKQQDKDWLAADMTYSPFRNNVYVAWTEFDKYGSANPQDSSRILLSRSTDAGRSWSMPVRVSDDGGNCLDGDSTVEGAVPAIGPHGEVYLAWSGPSGILFDRSTDGGLTFGKDIFVTTQPGGWDFSVPGIYRCNGLPITACDLSNSPYHGYVYVTWSDQRYGLDNTDVFLIRSTDGGATWGEVKRVNDDFGVSHQFFPWMAIDQSNGNLYFVFYDRRNTTGNATDVFAAKSVDGGETFTNFKVSQSSFTPTQSVFFGDYTNIAASGGSAYPIWMRLDGGILSVWVALVSGATSVSNRQSEPTVSSFRLDQNYPNPFNPRTVIGYRVSGVGFVSLKVYDLLGREVSTLLNEVKQPGTYIVEFDASGLPSGVYFYKLIAGNLVATRKLSLLK